MARTGKGFYFDKHKNRWIARLMINKQKHNVGSFATEQEANDAVRKYLDNLANQMPRRRANQQEQTTTKDFTLNDALEFIDTKLKNPQSTKDLYKRCLITFTRYAERIDEDDEDLELTLEEIQDIYGEVNLVEPLSDFDRTKFVVEEEIRNQRTGEQIAIDTIKQYYSSFMALFTRENGRLILGKEIEKQYDERLKYWNNESNNKRRLLIPKKYAEEDPSFTWEVMEQEYAEFIDTKKFSNTEQGKKDLRNAVAVGMYVLQRPRRVLDYYKLQFFSKKPSEKEQQDRSIVWLRKEEGKLKGTFYIDKFKIRTMVRKNTTKEVLPRYIKDINDRLAELLQRYITYFQIKDMSKLTAEEKRRGKNYYLFYPNDDQSVPYSKAGGFGKVVGNAMKKIFKNRKGLSVNAFRHNFNDWVSRNLKDFNDEKLKQIAIDVGDTFKDLPTNLRYRFATVENQDKAVSQIEEQIRDDYYAKKLYEADAEEQGSVMNEAVPSAKEVERMETINEDESELIETSAEDTWSVPNIKGRIGEIEVEIAKLLKEKERWLRMLVS